MKTPSPLFRNVLTATVTVAALALFGFGSHPIRLSDAKNVRDVALRAYIQRDADTLAKLNSDSELNRCGLNDQQLRDYYNEVVFPVLDQVHFSGDNCKLSDTIDYADFECSFKNEYGQTSGFIDRAWKTATGVERESLSAGISTHAYLMLPKYKDVPMAIAFWKARMDAIDELRPKLQSLGIRKISRMSDQALTLDELHDLFERAMRKAEAMDNQLRNDPQAPNTVAP
ncbi:MAG: hypothetical protein JSS72_13770 [Armatimonadetes bacterium]|nr:hypothetical protein [Armatimonadota bacterium]